MGLLDDARRHQREIAAPRVIGKHDDASLATKQRNEISEFITAMNELGVAPAPYPCTYIKHIANSSRSQRTGEIITGWHLGYWSAREVAGERPRKDQTRHYQVVTTNGEWRNTNVGIKRDRSIAIQLPYIGTSGVDKDPDPNLLSNLLRNTLTSILAGGIE